MKAKTPENLAYAVKDNVKVELAASGYFSITLENAPDVREYSLRIRTTGPRIPRRRNLATEVEPLLGGGCPEDEPGARGHGVNPPPAIGVKLGSIVDVNNVNKVNVFKELFIELGR